MRNEHREQWSALITGVAEMHGKQISPAGLRVWWNALARFEFDQVLAAMNAHTADPERGQFMPKPADVVRHIEGTPDENAMAAWAKVDAAIRHVGTGPTLVFDDPKIHIVLTEMGGLSKLGQVDEREFSILSHQFCKRYASIRGHQEHPPALVGWYTDGSKRYIGNQQLALEVEKSGTGGRLALGSAESVAEGLVQQMVRSGT